MVEDYLFASSSKDVQIQWDAEAVLKSTLIFMPINSERPARANLEHVNCPVSVKLVQVLPGSPGNEFLRSNTLNLSR